jgi:hypothetical protein
VICDLHRDVINKDGIDIFDTYAFNEPCALCAKGSMPVAIQGDVFLLEKPLINKLVLKTTDAPRNLSPFMESYHRKHALKNTFIKANFFESSVRSSASTRFGYEVFFDLQAVFEDLAKGGHVFTDFREKLNGYIHQYIPSNTRYIVHLNDKGSELFAQYLLHMISRVVKNEFLPEIIPMNSMHTMDEKKEGAAVIVCSSMVSGGNLIYVSKEMRKCNKLSIIYLVGFTRTQDDEYYKFIKNNLTQGIRGIDTNSFYSVETIHCNNDYLNTSWIVELDFVKTFMGFCDVHLPKISENVIKLFMQRHDIISNSMKVEERGLTDQLFYPNVYTGDRLAINKNFAFFNFGNYDKDASQADIYFTISTIINRLRHSKDLKRCLMQSEYVRNLLDPENFSRFNDGIIQASFLRAAHPMELAYDIDKEISRKFLTIINPIVLRAQHHFGEALFEFLYAIAIKKLRLEMSTLKELLALVKEKCTGNPVIEAICVYIDKVLVEKDPEIIKEYTIRYEFQ